MVQNKKVINDGLHHLSLTNHRIRNTVVERGVKVICEKLLLCTHLIDRKMGVFC